MRRVFLILSIVLSAVLAPSAIGAVVTQTGVTYTSTLDNLALKMDVAYDDAKTSQPVVLDLHGYSGPYGGQDIIQRMAAKGCFAIKTYKRGYGGSAGVQDDGGREIYDFWDAAQYVLTHYAAYVDPHNLNVVGYSGGGGNAYGLAAKFPDAFRSINVFFGMSDYGWDHTNGWWWNGGAGYRTGMQANIGGTPDTAPNSYYARALYKGAKNNRYSHIQLFYDSAEPTCPVVNATQWTSATAAAGWTNVTTRISDASTTVSEGTDNFSSGLAGYSFIGNGSTLFSASGGALAFSANRATTWSAALRKFDSLRNYAKIDHLKARFKVALASTATNGAVLFGLHQGSVSANFANSISVLILGSTAYLRVDYTSGASRDLATLYTPMTVGTPYTFEIEVNSSVASAKIMNAAGSTLGTQSVTMNNSGVFNELDTFGIYTYNDNLFSDIVTGTLDDVQLTAWARWMHGYPQEGSGATEGDITAENYFVPGIVAMTWPEPTLDAAGSLFVPGYVRTKKFQLMLGSGQIEAANIVYNMSGSAATRTQAKTVTVTPLTAATTAELRFYGLTASRPYQVNDLNLASGLLSATVTTTTVAGTLVISEPINSTNAHRYEVFAYVPYQAKKDVFSTIYLNDGLTSTPLTKALVDTLGGSKDWGVRSSPPDTPAEGDTYYDSALHKRRTWDGSAWQNHW